LIEIPKFGQEAERRAVPEIRRWRRVIWKADLAREISTLFFFVIKK